jgi:hypothetical protein
MKRSIIVVIVIAALAVTGAMAAVAERSYADAAGDSGTAPDLTSIDVSDANGFVVFKIGGTLSPLSSFEILIDTDRNQSTGREGDELWLSVLQEGDGKTYWDADRWDGSKWADAGLGVKAQGFPGRQEIGFPATVAGLNGPFDFTVLSVKMVADAIESADRAPDSIVPWTYELTTRAAESSAKATLGQVRLVPARAVAGKPVTVRVAVHQGDTKQPVASAVTTCSARVKGRSIRGRGTALDGMASCRLLVPRGTSGSLAQGSITVGSGRQSVTKTFRFRIA